MSSVREIARAVGVSSATVSRVINSDPRVDGEVRKRVLHAANQVRYVASVGRRPTTNIAFLYTSQPSLGSPYDTALLQGLWDGLEQSGLDLIILSTSRSRMSHESYSQMFMRRGVRGAILRAASDSHDICEQIGQEGFPAVVVGERFGNAKVSYVHADSRSATAAAVEHLIELGHRRIAIAINTVPDSDHADRFAGYRDALRAAGVPFDDRLVFHTWASTEGGAQVIRQFAAISPPPTAVCITDPMTAVGAMLEARAIGIRVPTDLSIVGFDDGRVRFMTSPTMTAVCQDASAIGRAALEVLQGLIADPRNHSPRRVLQAWFEVHGSTAPPASRAGSLTRRSRGTTRARRSTESKE